MKATQRKTWYNPKGTGRRSRKEIPPMHCGTGRTFIEQGNNWKQREHSQQRNHPPGVRPGAAACSVRISKEQWRGEEKEGKDFMNYDNTYTQQWKREFSGLGIVLRVLWIGTDPIGLCISGLSHQEWNFLKGLWGFWSDSTWANS